MQTWPDNNEFKEFLRISLKDFLCYSKSIFVFRSSVNSIGTEGTVYKKNRTFYNTRRGDNNLITAINKTS